MTNTVSSHDHGHYRVHAKHFTRSVRRLAHLVLVVSTLFVFKESVEASEVYVRLWGATGPYDPAIVAPSGTVTKILNRNLNTWSWRNYSAASIGGLVVSMREGLSGYNSSQVHQPVSATASWQDDITINSPGLTGQAGSLTMTYRVNGYLIFTGTNSQVPTYNSSRLSCVLKMNGTDVDAANYEIWDTGPYGSDFMNADRIIERGFTFGTPFTIKHTLTAYTAMDSRNSAPGRAEVEAASLWKGITVKYQDAPVTNFTSTSSTVPVWSQPLPRPLPPLTLSAPTNGAMVFSWPEQALCDLLASPDLGSWAVSTAQTNINGMFKTATVLMSEPQAFFRLLPTP